MRLRSNLGLLSVFLSSRVCCRVQVAHLSDVLEMSWFDDGSGTVRFTCAGVGTVVDEDKSVVPEVIRGCLAHNLSPRSSSSSNTPDLYSEENHISFAFTV